MPREWTLKLRCYGMQPRSDLILRLKQMFPAKIQSSIHDENQIILCSSNSLLFLKTAIITKLLDCSHLNRALMSMKASLLMRRLRRGYLTSDPSKPIHSRRAWKGNLYKMIPKSKLRLLRHQQNWISGLIITQIMFLARANKKKIQPRIQNKRVRPRKVQARTKKYTGSSRHHRQGTNSSFQRGSTDIGKAFQSTHNL